MEYLQNNLDGNNSLSMMKKILLLDLKAVMDKARKDIAIMIEQSQYTMLDVVLNDQRVSFLESEIAKYASISKLTPNRVNNFAPQNVSNLNILSSYNNNNNLNNVNNNLNNFNNSINNSFNNNLNI